MSPRPSAGSAQRGAVCAILRLCGSAAARSGRAILARSTSAGGWPFTVTLKVAWRFWETICALYGYLRFTSGIVMQTYNSQLRDINERIEDAIQNLRVQQTLVPDTDCPRLHRVLLTLLSNGLRVYCWLVRQRRGLHNNLDKI
jgi:hypothetical protein